MPDALDRLDRFARMKATGFHAIGRFDSERDWLDVLALVEKAKAEREIRLRAAVQATAQACLHDVTQEWGTQAKDHLDWDVYIKPSEESARHDFEQLQYVDRVLVRRYVTPWQEVER